MYIKLAKCKVNVRGKKWDEGYVYMAITGKSKFQVFVKDAESFEDMALIPIEGRSVMIYKYKKLKAKEILMFLTGRKDKIKKY